MRWFVVFLLLANLVLYLWVAYGESPRPAHELPPPDIGRLRLLHEAAPVVDAEPPASASAVTVVPLDAPPLREPAPRDDASDAAVTASALAADVDGLPPAGPPATSAPPRETVQAVALLSEAAEVPDESAETIQQTRPETIIDEPAVETPAVASVPVAVLEEPGAAEDTPVTTGPAGHSERVQQVSSMSTPLDTPAPEAASADAMQPVQPAIPVVTVTAASRCLRIGPLSVEQAEEMRPKIASPVAIVDEERRDVAVVDGYYVLIPPLPSRQEGNNKLDELSAAGVKDTWLFRSGELRNAISLGYFKREASARRHAETIRALGFDTEVREKPVQAQRLWLLLSSPPEFDAAALSDQAPDGSSIEAADCPAQ
jgi:hypothetical protein